MSEHRYYNCDKCKRKIDMNGKPKQVSLAIMNPPERGAEDSCHHEVCLSCLVDFVMSLPSGQPDFPIGKAFVKFVGNKRHDT